MKYDMKTPCAQCPFRTDIRPFIRPERVSEIEQSLINGDFPCHKTINYVDNDEDSEKDTYPDPNSQFCAGALILLEKLDQPSQLMRVAERLQLYDPKALNMKAPVYDSFDEMHAACTKEIEKQAGKRQKLPKDHVKEACEVAGGNCEQPAGWAEMGGIRINRDFKPIPMCNECGQPVCHSCSAMKGGKRICNECAENEE